MPVTIGELRWYVTLAKRQDVPNLDSGIIEQLAPIQTVHAAIKPTSLQSFIGAEQIDMPISHRIYIRWQPFADLSMFDVITRAMVLPDGSARTETFRVRRVMEWQGRHRFIVADCDLEREVDR